MRCALLVLQTTGRRDVTGESLEENRFHALAEVLGVEAFHHELARTAGIAGGVGVASAVHGSVGGVVEQGDFRFGRGLAGVIDTEHEHPGIFEFRIFGASVVVDKIFGVEIVDDGIAEGCVEELIFLLSFINGFGDAGGQDVEQFPRKVTETQRAESPYPAGCSNNFPEPSGYAWR